MVYRRQNSLYFQHILFMPHTKLSQSEVKNNKGFTLIELLVVISIISILSSVILVSLNGAREKAKVARAKVELNQLHLSIEFLLDDTGQHPGHYAGFSCELLNVDIPGVLEHTYLKHPEAGIQSTDGTPTNGHFPNWKGPYVAKVPKDPWGVNYYFDPNFLCGVDTLGCNGVSGTARVIQSFGPDLTQKGQGAGADSGDDVVLVLCRP